MGAALDLDLGLDAHDDALELQPFDTGSGTPQFLHCLAEVAGQTQTIQCKRRRVKLNREEL